MCKIYNYPYFLEQEIEKQRGKQLPTITWKIQTKQGFKLLLVSLYFYQHIADSRILRLLHANYIFFFTKFSLYGYITRWTPHPPSQTTGGSWQIQPPHKERAVLKNLKILWQKHTHLTPPFPAFPETHFQKQTNMQKAKRNLPFSQYFRMKAMLQ